VSESKPAGVGFGGAAEAATARKAKSEKAKKRKEGMGRKLEIGNLKLERRLPLILA
jgi:hypothetical protein